jgi:hypothetical protein
MVELAEIFQLHGGEYRAKFGDRMPAQHLRAMRAIQECRTASLGGKLYLCPKCNQQRYSYHSCKNRHCPKCQNDQANEWIQKQHSLLLPVTYFMVTFTLPAELRALARSHQKTAYNILFRAAAEALIKLTRDPRFLGALIGMVGVLHTWTRALVYHPHVHFIVTGGGLSQDGQWISTRPDFLVPVRALSVIFRAKVRDYLREASLAQDIDKQVWTKQWVVHAEPVGNGAAAFKYLAPYIFRVAISNNRIITLRDGFVTFKYKESATDQVKFSTLTAEEFIRRFLQHVLPPRLVKVRYYGLLSPRRRALLDRARQLLASAPPSLANAMSQAPQPQDPHPAKLDSPDNQRPPQSNHPQLSTCPDCGAVMVVCAQLPRQPDPCSWFLATTPTNDRSP